MKKIKACIFDLDGTLLDTPRGIAYHINEVFTSEGLGTISVDLARALMGQGAYDLITMSLSHVGVCDRAEIDRIFQKYIAQYNSAPDMLVEVYDGVRELIDELRAMGIKLAVLSNKQHAATVALVKKYFGDSFDMVLGGRDGIALKPDPESAYAIYEHFGVTGDECAYVGDSEPDVHMAQNAKMGLPIFVLWGLRSREQLESIGAECFVSEAREISELIKKHNN